jgi:hypothetical protein
MPSKSGRVLLSALFALVMMLSSMAAQIALAQTATPTPGNPTAVSDFQAFIERFTAFAIVASGIVTALVQVFKGMGLPTRWAPLVSVALGEGLSFLAAATDPAFHATRVSIATFAIVGLLVGLAASGVWSGWKATVMRYQAVPPGTAIKTTGGQVDTTPTDSFTDGVRGKKKPGSV